MRAYLVVNGHVENVVEVAHLNVMPGLVDAALGVAEIGDLWDGTAFTRPPRWATLAAALAARKREVTVLRLARELGGTTVSGQPVPTSIEFRLRLRELKADLDEGASTVLLQRANGTWASLSAAQLAAVSAAVRAHVKQCIEAERAHHDALDALGSVAAVEAYDISTGWPV